MSWEADKIYYQGECNFTNAYYRGVLIWGAGQTYTIESGSNIIDVSSYTMVNGAKRFKCTLGTSFAEVEADYIKLFPYWLQPEDISHSDADALTVAYDYNAETNEWSTEPKTVHIGEVFYVYVGTGGGGDSQIKWYNNDSEYEVSGCSLNITVL